MTSGPPTNAEIARRLKESRTLMEFAGEPFFKFMAYERAAETIENAAPLVDLAAAGRLEELPGVGKTIPSVRIRPREIARALGARYGLHALCAAEVAIRADGSLDADRAVLAALDLAIASVADGDPGGSREALTERLVRACENPAVTILAHPSGRRLSGFEGGFALDADAPFAAAARPGTALEIGADPDRLDLPVALARRAREFGVVFTCAPEAHDGGGLDAIGFAVGQARRGWLTASEVLNGRPLAGVCPFVDAKRATLSYAWIADPES